ncbi:MAG: hypothetical protein LUD50_02610, partial [Clostridia bacterium]|nr:hypothetical protein [Clostridia bacterium]
YSDANENVTDVYLKTEVWFSDEFGCDEIGFVAKACLGYWRETARACTQPFKMQLMESLREQSLNEGEFRDYTLDLRKIIAEEFKDEECCRRRLEWADEDIAAATKDR